MSAPEVDAALDEGCTLPDLDPAGVSRLRDKAAALYGARPPGVLTRCGACGQAWRWRDDLGRWWPVDDLDDDGG